MAYAETSALSNKACRPLFPKWNKAEMAQFTSLSSIFCARRVQPFFLRRGVGIDTVGENRRKPIITNKDSSEVLKPAMKINWLLTGNLRHTDCDRSVMHQSAHKIISE
ncbi:MAG: hypothetical protein ACXU7H_09030, partial [Burkholderiaceae bacterium]